VVENRGCAAGGSAQPCGPCFGANAGALCRFGLSGQQQAPHAILIAFGDVGAKLKHWKVRSPIGWLLGADHDAERCVGMHWH
jgi:hypothetical protein